MGVSIRQRLAVSGGLSFLLLLLLSSTSVYAKSKNNAARIARCLKALESGEESISFQDAEHSEVTSLIFEDYAKYVVRNQQLPTVQELYSLTGISISKLEEFLKTHRKSDSGFDVVEKSWELYPNLKKDFQLSLAASAAEYLKDRKKLPSAAELEIQTKAPKKLILRAFGIHPNGTQDFYSKIIEFMRVEHQKELEGVRNEIIDVYTKLSKETGITPSKDELAQGLGVKKEELDAILGKDRLFYSYEDLANTALRLKGKAFASVIDRQLFSADRVERMQKSLRERSAFLVTTAVANHSLNTDFFKAALDWAEKNNGDIFVVPANLQSTGISNELLNHPRVHIVVSDIDITPELQINKIDIMAKALRPKTGLEKLSQSVSKSAIVASTQVQHHFLPVSQGEYRTRELIFTGAITNPDYNNSRVVSRRTSTLAATNHQLGAVIVEKVPVSSEQFPTPNSRGVAMARSITFSVDTQGFTHDGVFYSALSRSEEKFRKPKVQAIVAGDLHVGITNDIAMQALYREIEKSDPEYLIVHDIYHGWSISHWESKNKLSLEKRAKHGMLSLSDELTAVSNEVSRLQLRFPKLKIVVVKANHNEWITRYLQDGRAAGDPQNMRVARILEGFAAQGKETLECLRTGLLEYDVASNRLVDGGLIPIVMDPSRLLIMERNQAFVLGSKTNPNKKVHVGEHFDKGDSGASASPNTFNIAMPNSTGAHTHVPQRIGNFVNVGTMTNLDGGYTGYIGKWMHGFATVDDSGEIQLHLVRFGTTGLKDYAKLNGVKVYSEKMRNAIQSPDFFDNGYPMIHTPRRFTHEDVDQYR